MGKLIMADILPSYEACQRMKIKSGALSTLSIQDEAGRKINLYSFLYDYRKLIFEDLEKKLNSGSITVPVAPVGTVNSTTKAADQTKKHNEDKEVGIAEIVEPIEESIFQKRTSLRVVPKDEDKSKTETTDKTQSTEDHKKAPVKKTTTKKIKATKT